MNVIGFWTHFDKMTYTQKERAEETWDFTSKLQYSDDNRDFPIKIERFVKDYDFQIRIS